MATVIGVEILGERPAWSMTGSEKLSTLDAVVAERARLKTVELQLIADLDQSGYTKDIGAGDTARLLSLRYRIDAAQAHRDVRLATALTKHPATAAALPDPATPFPDPATAHPNPNGDSDGCDADLPGSGEADGDRDAEGGRGAGESEGAVGWRVHPAQAEAIMAVLAKIPATAPVEDVEFAEQQLIGLAATHTPRELRRAGKRILDILDPDGPEPDEKKAYARESLTLKDVDQGVNFRGFLANENAELFRTLIHAGAKPHKTVDGELDPRPRDKRQADALTSVLNAAATGYIGTATGSTTSATQPGTGAATDAGTGVQPFDNVSGTAPGTTSSAGGATTDTGQDSLAGTDQSAGADADHIGAGAEDDSASDAGEFVAGYGPKAHISVTIDFNDLKAATANATGALVFGDTLSAAAIRRLACDAEVLPFVLGSKSQPLDVGTSRRLVTRPMRRALNARDKGCVVCGAPPIQCEAHHVVSWLDGGVTAVSNMVLLCKRHHHDLHSGHWQIRIIDGVVHVTRPTWADPDPIPRGRYRPPTTPDWQATGTTTGSQARAWPRTTDPRPPITTQAAHFTPWGEDPDAAPRIADPRPPTGAAAAHFNPWGDDPETAPDTTHPRPPDSAEAPPFDPWNDGPTTEASSAADGARLHDGDSRGIDGKGGTPLDRGVTPAPAS